MNNQNIEPLKDLASGAIISLLFGMAGYILMFLFKIFAARIFGPADLGLFEMANTLLNVGAIVSLVGIHAGVSRYIAVYEERREFDKLTGYLKFIFKMPVLLSLAVSIIIFLGADFINNFFGFKEIFSFLIRIVALVVPFKVVNEIIYQIFYAKRKVLLQNIGSNIIEKVFLVIGIFPIYFFQLGITHAVWLLFLSAAGALIFNLSCVKLRVEFKKTEKSVSMYKDWLFFSAPLFFSTVFAFVINWTDNIVIGKILDSGNLGIYATSFALASFLLFFQASFVGIFVPVMSRLYARGEKDVFLETYKKAQNWVFGFSLPAAMFFLFFSKEIIDILYGRSFIEGAPPLIILTVGILFNVYTGMNAPLLKIVKNTRFLFKVKIILALINVALNIILVRRYGILGAAISTSLVIASEQYIYLIKVKKYFKTEHDNCLNIKFLFVSIALIIAFKLFFAPSNFPGLLAISLAYVLFYFAILYFIGAIKKDDILTIKELVHKTG